MTKEQIIEGNKLIAEFMGTKRGAKYIDPACSVVGEAEFLCDEKDLEYHLSWDWLMPVVEKIETLGSQTFKDVGVILYSRFEIKHNHIKLHWSKDHNYQLTIEAIQKWRTDSCTKISKEYVRIEIEKSCSKLEALWLTCVGFIKWYNANER
jgi:hypothetical protein